MARTRAATTTGGRSETLRRIEGDFALCVGMPKTLKCPSGWHWSKLSDLARLESGHTPSRKHPEYWGGAIPWMGIRDAKEHHGGVIDDTDEHTNDLGIENSSARLLPAGTVCLSRTASVGYVVVMGQPMSTSQDFVNWICTDQLEPRFLQYLLIAEKSSLSRFSSGAVHQTIYFPEVKAFHICHPSRTEQRRIVGILDEAFAGIARAVAATEKNLANARELFESELDDVFRTRCESWNDFKLGEVCELLNGRAYKKAELLSSGKYPVLRVGNFFTNQHWYYSDLELESEKYCDNGDLLYAWSASFGPRIWDGGKVIYHYHIWRVDVDERIVTKEFLRYWLDWDAEQIKSEQGAGTTMIHVAKGSMEVRPIKLPDISEQARLVARLEELSTETQRLESLYRRKLAALAELRQALLQKAFAGELTADFTQPIAVPATTREPVPMGHVDLHAGILAIAFRAHRQSGKLNHFGHVKAEKIVHMIEARLCIDLGRQPVKAAAGPNDYPRLLKVEHRAEKRLYFSCTRRGTRYEFAPLENMDSHISATETALGDRLKSVNELIALMLPMDTQQAEIFATVYAAWNNLLIAGEPATDEAIVHEARENWHPDKLRIDRDKFFKAIDWLRRKELTPTGSGIRVEKAATGN